MSAIRRRGSTAGPLAGVIIGASAALVALGVSIPNIERVHRSNLNLHYSAQRILSKMRTRYEDKPVKPLAFIDAGIIPLHIQYMQFMSDGDWYTTNSFEVQAFGGFGFFGL